MVEGTSHILLTKVKKPGCAQETLGADVQEPSYTWPSNLHSIGPHLSPPNSPDLLLTLSTPICAQLTFRGTHYPMFFSQEICHFCDYNLPKGAGVEGDLGGLGTDIFHSKLSQVW